MPKCIKILPCDWLISYLCQQAIEQAYLIKWLVSVCVNVYLLFVAFMIYLDRYSDEQNELYGREGEKMQEMAPAERPYPIWYKHLTG